MDLSSYINIWLENSIYIYLLWFVSPKIQILVVIWKHSTVACSWCTVISAVQFTLDTYHSVYLSKISWGSRGDRGGAVVAGNDRSIIILLHTQMSK